MKFRNLVCTLLAVLGMVSCTAESDTQMTREEEKSVTLESTFNARSVNYAEGNKISPSLSELPPVTIEEAKSILNTLRAENNPSVIQNVETKEGEPGQKFLTVSTECTVNSANKLTLQLILINYEDDGSLYYKDYKATASSSLYKWHMNGFGLSTSGTSGLYKFDCISYLYFKIAEEGEITYLQVPLKVSGNYNPADHHMEFKYSI